MPRIASSRESICRDCDVASTEFDDAALSDRTDEIDQAVRGPEHSLARHESAECVTGSLHSDPEIGSIQNAIPGYVFTLRPAKLRARITDGADLDVSIERVQRFVGP